MPRAYTLVSLDNNSSGVVSNTFRQFSKTPAGVVDLSVRLTIYTRSIATFGASSW